MEEEIRPVNPLTYLKIFYRRKWLFILPVCIGFWVSIVALFVLPKTYESSTLILVEEEKIINPLITGIAVSTSMAERLRTLKEQILSWNRLTQLVQKLDMAKDVKNQPAFEKIILRLRDNIGVQLRGQNLVRIFYQGKDPAQTQETVKAITDIFIKENINLQNKESDVAIDFLGSQLKVYEKKIKESEIASMEDELKRLLVDSTEAHPLVKELRERIAKTRQDLSTGNFKVNTSVAATNPLYGELQREVAKIESNAIVPDAFASEDKNLANNVYKMVLIDKMDTVLARDSRVNENIYNMLLNRLETAKITKSLEASKEGTRYTILDPPRYPYKPAKPNKFLVIFLGIFLGGFAGAGTVLGAEFMDHSFLEIDDAKQTLDLPILGAISKIATEEDINKDKVKQKKLLKFISITSGVLLFILILFSILRKV